LVEAARIDGRPDALFVDVLVPLSKTSVAALFVISVHLRLESVPLAAFGDHRRNMYPVVMGIKRMFAGGDAANEWNVINGHRDR